MARDVPPRTERALLLADGRRLSWAEYGEPDGAPLVMLHGIPGSRLQSRGCTGPRRMPGSG